MYDNTPAPPPVPWYPAPAYPQSPYLPHPYQFPVAPARQHLWLPVLSLVMSAVALLGVLGLAVSGAGAGPSWSLTGRVQHLPKGVLAGRDLSPTLRDVLEQDGDEVSVINCPDTPHLGQGVVTVCHGAMDGNDWAFIVYFENDQGVFTLQPL